jgi:hypothetical protein
LLRHGLQLAEELDLRTGFLTRVPTHVELARALRG